MEGGYPLAPCGSPLVKELIESVGSACPSAFSRVRVQPSSPEQTRGKVPFWKQKQPSTRADTLTSGLQGCGLSAHAQCVGL